MVLRTLELYPQPRVQRVVLLGTPIGDSFGARGLARLPFGRTLLGRSMADWLTVGISAGVPGVEIGTIAGNLRFGLGAAVVKGMPPPNDGVVTVGETRFAGMRDHLVMPVSHSGMVLSSAVARQVCEFLERGAFLHADAPR